MRANILFELNDEYTVVEDLDRDNEPAIMDCDGERVMPLHPACLGIARNILKPILLDMLRERDQTIDRVYSDGANLGRQRVHSELHELLGIDRIEAALDRIADELTGVRSTIEKADR